MLKKQQAEWRITGFKTKRNRELKVKTILEHK
jgi:hypothetical protein